MDSGLEVTQSIHLRYHATLLRGHLDMATYDALERLQKFDWLIQKLHNIRSTLQSEQGLQELQKLHALQLLQKSDYHFNGASIGESEDDKMELCKNEGEEEDEEEVLDEEEEEDIIEDVYVKDEEQTLPLALTTSSQSAECKELVQQLPPVQSEAKLRDVPESAPAFPPSSSAPPTFPPTSLPPAFPSRSPYPAASPPAPLTKPREADRQNGFSPVRFPTGLFPPLPFDGMFPMLTEEAEIKVGSSRKSFIKVCYKLVGFYSVQSQLRWSALQSPPPHPNIESSGIFIL